ncbi:hypothetical protein IDH41_24915 [Paenibacillus sp. IB182493]|uniref:Uncharacterized protein n=1 Tax=Paenibacillus arenilitoris TaxID=2772299 RepID=A0A927CQD8_9BACL|nr:hypothetical protein [Paenibacillus arenilitoris]
MPDEVVAYVALLHVHEHPLRLRLLGRAEPKPDMIQLEEGAKHFRQAIGIRAIGSRPSPSLINQGNEPRLEVKDRAHVRSVPVD